MPRDDPMNDMISFSVAIIIARGRTQSVKQETLCNKSHNLIILFYEYALCINIYISLFFRYVMYKISNNHFLRFYIENIVEIFAKYISLKI